MDSSVISNRRNGSIDNQPTPDRLVKIRFRDLLFPRRLLDATGWEENPLVIHSKRRARRWHRRIARLFFEVVLVLFPIWLLVKYFNLDWRTGIGLWPPQMFWLVFGNAFLLLRYHLFVNDQSHHTKSLGRDEMPHLLQTPLGRDEFFLHHLLFFCLRYRVIVGLFVFAGASMGANILRGGHEWVLPNSYIPILVGLNLVLFTWVAGAAQYIVEWRVFAGGRFRYVRSLLSWTLSVLFSGSVMGLMYALIVLAELRVTILLLSPALTLAVFFGLAYLLLLLARAAYCDAMDVLWLRFCGDDPDSAKTREVRFRAFDLIRPWKRRPLVSDDARQALRALHFGRARHRVYRFLLFALFAAAFLVCREITQLALQPKSVVLDWSGGIRTIEGAIVLGVVLWFAASAICVATEAGRSSQSTLARSSLATHGWAVSRCLLWASLLIFLLRTVGERYLVYIISGRSTPVSLFYSLGYDLLNPVLTFFRCLAIWASVVAVGMWGALLARKGRLERSALALAVLGVVAGSVCAAFEAGLRLARQALWKPYFEWAQNAASTIMVLSMTQALYMLGLGLVVYPVALALACIAIRAALRRWETRESETPDEEQGDVIAEAKQRGQDTYLAV